MIRKGTVFREGVQSAQPYIETMTQTRYWYEGPDGRREHFGAQDAFFSMFFLSCYQPVLYPSVAILLRRHAFCFAYRKDDEISISPSAFNVRVLE